MKLSVSKRFGKWRVYDLQAQEVVSEHDTYREAVRAYYEALKDDEAAD